MPFIQVRCFQINMRCTPLLTIFINCKMLPLKFNTSGKIEWDFYNTKSLIIFMLKMIMIVLNAFFMTLYFQKQKATNELYILLAISIMLFPLCYSISLPVAQVVIRNESKRSLSCSSRISRKFVQVFLVFFLFTEASILLLGYEVLIQADAKGPQLIMSVFTLVVNALVSPCECFVGFLAMHVLMESFVDNICQVSNRKTGMDFCSSSKYQQCPIHYLHKIFEEIIRI